jgi:polysaccharide biosynthesis transport protein
MTAAQATPHKRSVGLDDASAGAMQVVRMMRKYWPLLVAASLLSTGLALIYSKTLPRVYDATTMIELNATVIRPLGEKSDDLTTMGESAYWDNQEYYETQYKIVVSQRVLGEVVRNLGLANDPDFVGDARLASSPSEAAIASLQGRVRVEPVKSSRLFVLHVEDKDPKRAVRIADAVAATYIDQNLQSAISGSADAASWLADQLDRIKQDLEKSEDALYAFKRSNDLPSTSINEASNMIRLEMQEYDTALARTRTRKQELLARDAELSKVSEDTPEQLPSSELLDSTFLQHLRTEYLDAVRERGAVAAEGKGENHPLYKQASDRVEETRTALLAEVRNIKGAVERDLAVIQHQEEGESALFEQARKRAVELNMKEIEYHRLDRAREQNEKLHGLLLERMKEADLTRMMHVNNIRLVDRAVEPHVPIRPRTSVNVAIGALLGLLLGIALAWLRDVFDRSIKTPADVESLQVTFLGLLPRIDDNAESARRSENGRRSRASRKSERQYPELIVHDHPMSGVAEAARSIRTNLLFMSPDRPYRTILVSSAAPEEGKTTVACSIAIALAQGGQRVCMVDCDLRRPRLHRIFGRAGDVGVTNVLVGDVTLEEAAKPTVVPNLWSIPAGPLPPNPADMLQSERFRKFVADLTERFDRVVIDSAPLVAVTDSAIISRSVDGTVFVVRAFETSKQLSAQGLRSLRDVESPIVGAVLNAVDLSRHEYSYQYHYYYYHKREGYGARDVGEDEADRAASPPN